MPWDKVSPVCAKNRIHAVALILLIASFDVLYFTGCASQSQVSYQRDVYPILKSKCIGCHIPPDGEGYHKVGLDLTTHANLMKGTFYGPVIEPGDSQHSILNMLVEGRAGELSRVLEENHIPMTDQEIKILDLWVEQGALNN